MHTIYTQTQMHVHTGILPESATKATPALPVSNEHPDSKTGGET